VTECPRKIQSPGVGLSPHHSHPNLQSRHPPRSLGPGPRR
jgi:hypothetical protein